MSNPIVDTNYAYLSYNALLILSQCPYRLTLSIEELTKPAAKNRGDSEKPPRPQNSWIIFRRDYEAHLRFLNQHVKKEVKNTAHECSLKWKNLPSEVKQFFKILEKIAYENHKSLYPNYKYKPRNVKDSNVKKWVFREQKKYAFTSSPMPASMSNNFPSQEAAQTFSSPSLNDTISTTAFSRTVITTSTTTIDGTHPPIINTNENSDIYEILMSDPHIPINNSLTLNHTTYRYNPTTPLESQQLSQPFTQEYDLLNVDFENLLYDNFSNRFIPYN